MSAPINGARAPLSDPCEEAVGDWIKLRLAGLRERSGHNALSVHAIWYPHLGEIGVTWTLHAGDECVTGQRTIADARKALKEKLAERETTELRA